ncbi:MAG: 30S ribosomal protein S2 [Candidatus Kapaibacterium sp.]|jgi:small subunit ribosomal protein S2|nr:30S ribosomal protein S2 [Candidatus Kapabacteria bacterium]
MEHSVSIEALLESGAHFGHLTRRWNPKMSPFIFMERNGIHIIDLRKTQVLLEIAKSAIYDIACKGKVLLFVGTKQQAKGAIAEQAGRAGINYVSERWLGGMLTNFVTIRKSIKRLTAIDKMEVDGTFEKITKKERLLISRERDRLRKMFGGIETMTRLPGAIFVVDIRKEHLAIKEAKILGIPVIGIVDTNADPDDVDYPIPANDDSIKTIEIIASVMADAVIEGSEVAKVRNAELNADGADKDVEIDDEDGKVKRRIRERRVKRSDRRRPAPTGTPEQGGEAASDASAAE